MTQMGDSTRAWDGAVGVVDAKLLERASRALAEPIYYLAGPPAMVSGLRATLQDFGVDEDDVRSEEFFGY
jgi:ferredoxin-NADP reductase